MKKFLLFLMFALFCIPWAANAQQALPYSYGFEDNDLSADGWVTVSTASSGIIPAQEDYDIYPHNGTYLFYFSYQDAEDADVYLVSPQLTGGTFGVSVSFYYMAIDASYLDHFKVGYTTDASVTDPTQFIYGDLITASTSWQEYTAVLPAGAVRVAIMYDQDNYDDGDVFLLDDFTFEVPSDCAKPTNLVVTYEGGTTATVTWESDAHSFNIDVNGMVTSVTGNTYTLNDLEYATSYTVQVQADCGGELSGWASQSFRTECDVTPLPFFCGFEDESEYECLSLSNTASGTGLTNGTDYVHSGSLAFAFAYNTNPPQYLLFPEFAGTAAINMSFFYKIRSSNYPETFQVGYSTTTQTISAFTWLNEVTATNASEWLEYVETLPNGTKYVAIRYNSNDMYYLYLDDFNFEVATGCIKPTGLEANTIGTNSAVLNWTGDSESYVLQYRTAAHDNMNQWEQVGDDIIGTATLTQYTFDLSNYSGTGNIAIRHYNVSDMFKVVVDDIVVTNAGGQEVVNEGFEESVPSDWQIVDYDGDGNNWGRANFSSADIQNGSYCMSSASWNNVALTPDNWMIIPNVELGGTLTFYMRGTDASFPQENIGVFVTTASLDDIFSTTPAGDWSADIATNETSYELTGLEANTLYEWRVKGICGSTESNWASSDFTTIAEGFKTFVTAGNWDVDNNWFPVGVPTIEDEVSIEAAAIIPDGVVAVAKRATLGAGGSITIEDGGQLKQGAATLRVTAEKDLAADNYYFISSPFSGRTLYHESGTWSRVDNLLNGNYDFYAFDPTAELEWINYKAEPEHLSFQSDNGNAGLMYGEGYLYANEAATTLSFVGTAGKSVDYTETRDVAFDATSTDSFNGWIMVGNFFTCNAYINYVDAAGTVLAANLYVLNATGDGFELASSNMLAPLTAAFMQVNDAGKIQYSTEPIDASPALSSTNAPCLPALGEETSQDGNCPVPCETIVLTEEAPTKDWTFEGLTTVTEPYTGVGLGNCWTWTRTTEIGDLPDTLPHLYYNSEFAHSGDYSLRLWFRGVYAMPMLDENVNINRVKMSFWSRHSYPFYT
ncbi:MAG: choice-of-anchor J domain-containing protein, partial [Bacteroidales bacterium]|nr:choice-of-anchor J domain-containing protein [Bacteroidales bacterium]